MINKHVDQRLDAEVITEIVSFDDVEFIDNASLDEFNALADTNIWCVNAPCSHASSAPKADAARKHEPRAFWFRAGAAFARGLVVAAGATLEGLRVGGRRVISIFRGLLSRGIHRRNALVSQLVRRNGSEVLTTRMSAVEIARLNVVAASCGSSASTVVRTLVLQEYQKLAGTRRLSSAHTLSCRRESR